MIVLIMTDIEMRYVTVHRDRAEADRYIWEAWSEDIDAAWKEAGEGLTFADFLEEIGGAEAVLRDVAEVRIETYEVDYWFGEGS